MKDGKVYLTMDNVMDQIIKIAMKYNIKKVILFGSRARGDHLPTSDYDIAVVEKYLSAIDKAQFSIEVEEINTLKKIDIVFISDNSNDELIENIQKDGVVLWES